MSMIFLKVIASSLVGAKYVLPKNITITSEVNIMRIRIVTIAGSHSMLNRDNKFFELPDFFRFAIDLLIADI